MKTTPIADTKKTEYKDQTHLNQGVANKQLLTIKYQATAIKFSKSNSLLKRLLIALTTTA